MHLIQALPAGDIKGFFFDWYPVFGVFFMFALLPSSSPCCAARWARPSRRR